MKTWHFLISSSHIPTAIFPAHFDRLKEETLSGIVPYASPDFCLHNRSIPGAKFPPPLVDTLWCPTQGRELPPQEPSGGNGGPGAVKLISNPLSRRFINRSHCLVARLERCLGLSGLRFRFTGSVFLNGLLMALPVGFFYLVGRTVAPDRTGIARRLAVFLLCSPYYSSNVFTS